MNLIVISLIVLFVAFIMFIVIRGLIKNDKRNSEIRRYYKMIINPMKYIEQLRDEGFLGVLYKIDGCKNDTLIDGSYKKLLDRYTLFIEQYETTISVLKCFLIFPRYALDCEIYLNYSESVKVVDAISKAILKRESIMYADMMKCGIRTYGDYMRHMESKARPINDGEKSKYAFESTDDCGKFKDAYANATHTEK